MFYFVAHKVLTKSTSMAYCVANTKTVGALGKVPYKNPYVLRSRVSDWLTPGFTTLMTSLVTKGRTILLFKKLLVTC